MNPLERAKARVANRALKVALPEGTDARVLAAARALTTAIPTLEPIVLGNEEDVRSRCEALQIPLDGIRICDPATDPSSERLAQAYCDQRPDTSRAIANRLARKPMYHAGLMLRTGAADAMVAGVTCPTARVIEAAMLTVGLQPRIKIPSSFFIMIMPGGRQCLIFSDCAVNIEPNVEELAAIGIASAHSCANLLGEEPRTAFLSFSTHGSAQHPLAVKMRQAAAQAQALCPQFIFEGELQADAALVPRIAALKAKTPGGIAGNANVLVFPDLSSANISYKLVQHLAGAVALGPFLQGFAAPVSDLSRGATVQDVVDTAIITASSAVK